VAGLAVRAPAAQPAAAERGQVVDELGPGQQPRPVTLDDLVGVAVAADPERLASG
jgi:hypothetical protein